MTQPGRFDPWGYNFTNIAKGHKMYYILFKFKQNKLVNLEYI